MKNHRNIHSILFLKMTRRQLSMSLLRNTVMYIVIDALLFLMKGGESMVFVTISVSLIVAKRKNINDIPANLRDAVLEDLNAIGFDGYGEPVKN